MTSATDRRHDETIVRKIGGVPAPDSDPSPLRTAARLAGAVLATVLVGGDMIATAGHSVTHYPSYYPSEIQIDTIDPAAAAKGLTDGTLQAYVGEQPAFSGAVPTHVKPVVSLQSFVVLAFDRDAPASAKARCATARAIAAALRSAKAPGFVLHPYPVTPFHADYSDHLDRVEEAFRALDGTVADLRSLTVRGKGKLAQSLVGIRWKPARGEADVVLEQVTVDELIARAGAQLGDTSGPPWVKEGWFQAHQLLTPGIGDGRQSPGDGGDDSFARLASGRYVNLVDRLNVERRLLDRLTGDCRRMVVGYTERTEYSNSTFESGIENIAVDSQQGLNSPIFVRTAKLKEYPWNGTLRLGVPARADAAWNPVAGFTDATGRLVWAALGDAAMIPFPDNASWLQNRVHFESTIVRGQSGGVSVPADALRPEPGTGALKAVGPRQFASAKVVYDILPSPFLDGTEIAMADVVYPYVFTFRWGQAKDRDDTAYEPRLAAVLANVRHRLAGIKPLRMQRTVKAIAPGLDVVQHAPVLEVYLRDAPGDEQQIAALSPPWSTVPWHLLALMEDAVERGDAAFSQSEALRRKTRWLDLVHDRSLREKLLERIAVFERDGYRPDALKEMVSADEARRRWRALRTFAEQNGHLLVTNGPYRLKAWTPDAIVVQAVREPTYPLGFGTFDRLAYPPRAVIREAAIADGKIVVRADAEFTVKVERHYRITREPLTRKSSHRLFGLLVVSRYLLIGADGTVIKADKMLWEDDGRFSIALPPRLKPGPYTVVFAILLDANTIHPPAKVLHFRIDPTGTPG